MGSIHLLGICVSLAVCCAGSSPRSAEAAQSRDGINRAMLAAIRDGDKAAVHALLAQGANVNAPDEAGATALFHATLNADIGMMQLLLNNGAKVNAETRTKATPLIWGLHDPDKVTLLLDHGAKVSDEAIFASAAIPRGGSVFKLLADAGADLNVNRNGYTTLMAASRSGSLDTIRFLIAKGADVRARNRIGYTALYGTAFWPGSSPIVGSLLEKGADANVRVELSEPAEDVITGLMGAAMHGDVQVVQALLDNGADCNVQGGEFGRTALLLAATTGSEETVRLLLEKGADVNARDHLGNSSLEWARRRGDTSIVKLLAKAGAKEPARSSRSRDLPRLQPKLDTGAVERALANSLPLLQRSGRAFSERKSCVSCHHHALVAMAVGSARKNGFAADETIAAHEQARALGVLEKSRERMLLGSGVTDELAPAYILAGLDAGSQQTNQITDALVQFLALRQQPDGSWKTPVNRPPHDASDFTFTALAVRGLGVFAPKGRAQEIGSRIALARVWLLKAKAQETEELAFRLLGLRWASANQTSIDLARDALLRQQRADGGWAQLPTLQSDAYATGLALFALHEGGRIAVDHPAFRRGVEYLLRMQIADGSWFVPTRSFPLQPFVGTRFPHGRSQFISVAATCWASMALSLGRERAP
jgi:ankyrin repeat protein